MVKITTVKITTVISFVVKEEVKVSSTGEITGRGGSRDVCADTCSSSCAVLLWREERRPCGRPSLPKTPLLIATVAFLVCSATHRMGRFYSSLFFSEPASRLALALTSHASPSVRDPNPGPQAHRNEIQIHPWSAPIPHSLASPPPPPVFQRDHCVLWGGFHPPAARQFAPTGPAGGV